MDIRGSVFKRNEVIADYERACHDGNAVHLVREGMRVCWMNRSATHGIYIVVAESSMALIAAWAR